MGQGRRGSVGLVRRSSTHPGAIGKTNAYFYKKLQYRGSVNYAKRNKKQPLPQSRNILSQQNINLQQGVGMREHREEI